MTDDVQRRNREVLDAVRIRRDAFYDAVIALEQALAAPAGDDAPGWAAMLTAPVEHLREVLEGHIAGTEGPDGLFEEILDQAPRLAHDVERLQADHAPLVAATRALAGRLTSVANDGDVDSVRADALELVQLLLAHRHRGAELVYDAYAIDVSTGD
jgi:hypothetical protein